MNIASHVEHTLLKSEANVQDIIKLCQEAVDYKLFGVCVNPCYVALAKHLLTKSQVQVVTVIGFPLGANLTAVKAAEARAAVSDHADEVDMVMNIGAFKSGNYGAVVEDIQAVVAAATPQPVKVIIETCLLTDAEKARATQLVAQGGAQFVKTSTGFGSGGATVHDVEILRREATAAGIGVKAAGGIRDRALALELLQAGADRLGTSAGPQLVGNDDE